MFRREERYAVLKHTDVHEALTLEEIDMLLHIEAKIDACRFRAGKPPLKCVVVESDWPEYEPTWNAIEQRVVNLKEKV